MGNFNRLYIGQFCGDDSEADFAGLVTNACPFLIAYPIKKSAKPIAKWISQYKDEKRGILSL